MAEFSTGDEFERNTIHAIAQTTGLWAVIENVPQMTSAAPAMHLRADQDKKAAVLHRLDGSLDRGPEARPTRFAIELGA